jgi:hypothetical protein
MSVRTIRISVVASSVPAWVPSSIGAVNTINTNTLDDVDPGFFISGFSTFSGLFAWSGGVYARDYSPLGALVVRGGGHNNYPGNECYAFDFDTRAWQLCGTTYPTAQPWSNDYVNGEVAPGVPSANHTYDTLQYVPASVAGNTRGWLTEATISSYAMSQGGTASGQSHKFDLSTNLWSRLSSNKAGLGVLAEGISGSPAFAGSTAYDTQRGRIWWFPKSNTVPMRYLDLSTLAWNLGTYTGDTSYSAASVYVPTIDRIVTVDAFSNPATIRIFNPATQTAVTRTPAGGPSAQSYSMIGVTWCGDANKVLVLGEVGTNAPNTVYSLTPPENPDVDAWAWSSQAFTGSTVQTTGQSFGTCSRFQYVPSLKSAVYVARVDGPVYCFRVA